MKHSPLEHPATKPSPQFQASIRSDARIAETPAPDPQSARFSQPDSVRSPPGSAIFAPIPFPPKKESDRHADRRSDAQEMHRSAPAPCPKSRAPTARPPHALPTSPTPALSPE